MTMRFRLSDSPKRLAILYMRSTQERSCGRYLP
jgi:hypothetical protein